jgi:hypothetical protein
LSNKVERLGERVDKITHTGNWDSDLTTAEANSVRELWIQLHWTDAEAKEYSDAEKRQEEICAAAGSVYLDSEQNREYMRLATRQTELVHDLRGKRVGANHAMRDKVWPELVPRALRYWKLVDKPREQLTDAEAEELEGLLEWFSKLQAEALKAAESELSQNERAE